MTEAEALERVCPFAFGSKQLSVISVMIPAVHLGGEHLAQAVLAVEESDDLEAVENCLGSECMAWSSKDDNRGFCKLITKG